MATIAMRYKDSLVRALAGVSPLARKKIRETLLDFDQEITWNHWTSVLNAHRLDQAEPKACGCLMMDGYLKEHPPVVKKSANIDRMLVVDEGAIDDWEVVLAEYYEMTNGDYLDPTELVSNVASAYDNLVKYNHQFVKTVGGVEVLRVPARRWLVTLVDKAEAHATAYVLEAGE